MQRGMRGLGVNFLGEKKSKNKKRLKKMQKKRLKLEEERLKKMQKKRLKLEEERLKKMQKERLKPTQKDRLKLKPTQKDRLKKTKEENKNTLILTMYIIKLYKN